MELILGLFLFALTIAYILSPMSISQAKNTLRTNETKLYKYNLGQNGFVTVDKDTLVKYPDINEACEVLEVNLHYNVYIID